MNKRIRRLTTSAFEQIPQPLVSSLLSTPVVRNLIRPALSKTPQPIKSLLVANPFFAQLKVSELLEIAFDRMANIERGEYFYKYALLQKHVLSRSGSKSARVFFEFRSGLSKLDSLVARESLHAVEIKTDLDHFRRLPTQIHDYRRRFAHVWVFASERHASKLEVDRALPKAVGIAFMSRRLTFSTIREAERDVSQLNSGDILGCLQRREYLEILREYGFDASDMPNTLLFGEAMKFSARIDPELVHEATLAQLKGRAGASAHALTKLPRYIRAAVVAAGCDDVDVEHLLANLRKKVGSLEKA